MAAVALGRDFVFKVGLLEVCPSGIAEVDALAGGLPQGGLTEVYGPASSGRTSLMLVAMAQSTSRENVCALVDARYAFGGGEGSACAAPWSIRPRCCWQCNSSRMPRPALRSRWRCGASGRLGP